MQKQTSLSLETWSFEPRVDGGSVEFEDLNLCIQLIGDCLMETDSSQIPLCGATVSLMSSGATYRFRVGDKCLCGVSIDVPSGWLPPPHLAGRDPGRFGVGSTQTIEAAGRI